MSAINDGGPAFPVPMFTRQSDGQPMSAGEFFEGGNGLSLRDWFAGMALQGWLASYTASSVHPVANDTQHAAAMESYKMADAMIAAREHTQK